MKKLTVILTAAALATALGGTAALAAGGMKQTHAGSRNQTPSVSSCSYCTDPSHCYTDADDDGICDYSPRQNSASAAADSPVSSCGYCTDTSHCYTDADGDGICDYSPRQNSPASAADSSCGYGTGCHGSGRGSANGHHGRH